MPAQNDDVEQGFRVATYGDYIRRGGTDSGRYRTIPNDLPRPFRALPRNLQEAALGDPAPLSGPRSDALLAAMVEHVARLHGHPIPDWFEEPSRFLDRPWGVSKNPVIAADSALYAAGEFIRHGALADPAEMDWRGGRSMN